MAGVKLGDRIVDEAWQTGITVRPILARQCREAETCEPQTFKTKMTKKKYKILLLEPSNVAMHPFLGFDHLTQEVHEAHRQCYEKRHPFFVQVGRALQAANTYAPVIDVMIQQQPFVVNLVWGSIRFIIQVSWWFLLAAFML